MRGTSGTDPYFSTDLDGITRVRPSRSQRRRILESVESAAEADFPEVFLTAGDGSTLAYRAGGYLVWESGNQAERVLPEAGLEVAERAWDLLAEGRRDELESLPWQPLD